MTSAAALILVSAHISSAGRLAAIGGGTLVIWAALALATAEYGHGKGYPVFPLFVAAFFMGFPLVLLAITIGFGPRSRNPDSAR